MRTKRLRTSSPSRLRQGRFTHTDAAPTPTKPHPRTARVAATAGTVVTQLDQALDGSALRLTNSTGTGLRRTKHVGSLQPSRARVVLLRGTVKIRTIEPEHYRPSAEEWAEYLHDEDDD